MIAEELIAIDKPTVFTISSNAEEHDIQFKGIPIKSSTQLEKLILQSPKVKCEEIDAMLRINEIDERRKLFICNGKNKEQKEHDL